MIFLRNNIFLIILHINKSGIVLLKNQ